MIVIISLKLWIMETNKSSSLSTDENHRKEVHFTERPESFSEFRTKH